MGTYHTTDQQFRDYLGLKNENGGIYVSSLIDRGSAASSGIRKGDVILDIDGHPLDSSGNYQDEQYGTTHYTHLIRGKPYAGDQIPITVMRDGEQLTIDVTMNHLDRSKDLIEPYQYDTGPKYLIVGGLVFQELTKDYLETWGKEWRTKAPLKLVYAYDNQKEFRTEGREKLIILSRILPNEATTGYDRISSTIVHEVNGKSIGSIKDLAESFNQDNVEIHKIKIDSSPHLVYLDAEKAKLADKEVQKRYRIRSLGRMSR